jgi:hypothetical protein
MRLALGLASLAFLACTTRHVTSSSGQKPAGEKSPATSSGPSENPGGAQEQAAPPNLGSVFLTSVTGTSMPPSSSASASFVEASSTRPATACTEETVEACVLTRCPLPAATNAATPDQKSAGAITLSFGSQSVELLPSSTGGYKPLSKGSLWSAGDSIGVSAEGADVPAFDTAVDAPAPINVMTPQFVMGGSVGIVALVPADGDIPIAWSSTGSSGRVEVVLTTRAEDESYAATCTYDGATREATLPFALMDHFPRDPNTTISIVSVNRETVDSGSWRISVQATAMGIAKSGGFAAAGRLGASK